MGIDGSRLIHVREEAAAAEHEFGALDTALEGTEIPGRLLHSNMAKSYWILGAAEVLIVFWLPGRLVLVAAPLALI